MERCRLRLQEATEPRGVVCWPGSNIPKYDLQKLDAVPRLPAELKQLIITR
jgi:hypothetical protein